MDKKKESESEKEEKRELKEIDDFIKGVQIKKDKKRRLVMDIEKKSEKF